MPRSCVPVFISTMSRDTFTLNRSGLVQVLDATKLGQQACAASSATSDSQRHPRDKKSRAHEGAIQNRADRLRRKISISDESGIESLDGLG